MIEFFLAAVGKFNALVAYLLEEGGLIEATLKFIPFVLFFELPLMLLILFGIMRYAVRRYFARSQAASNYFPAVSCVVSCYAEGEQIVHTIRSLATQLYAGPIEIIALVDGAAANVDTYRMVQNLVPQVARMANRRLRVLPKWQRGGRVSSSNAGMALANGDVIISMDADTTVEHDAIYRITRHFADPKVVAVACSLRVANAGVNPLTALQALEYMLSITAGRTGLSELDAVNNISGAMGAFRRDFLRHVGGWDSGSAEDIDLTTRIKAYFGRHPDLRIVFDPEAVGRTIVPETLGAFLRQRLRWDGDLFYIFVRKYWRIFSPRLLGWRNFIIACWSNLFFQLLMPFAILIYTGYIFLTYPPATALAVLGLVYLFYLAVAVIWYLTYMLVLSDRPGEDWPFVFLLPFYPFYTFLGRCWNAVAILAEGLAKTHLDSTMAPWWVLRRTKF